jgi:hypothetical protein
MTNLIAFNFETGVKGLSREIEVEYGSLEWVSYYTLEVMKRYASRSAIGTYHNASDIEDYLMEYAYEYIMDNPRFQSEKGIRQVVKSRITDYFKSPTQNLTNTYSFSALSSQDDEGSEVDFESSHVEESTIFSDSSVDSLQLKAFLCSLSEKHRTILLMDSNNFDFREIGEAVFPDLSYSSARKSVQRNLKQITELALDFGLEEL